jgi:hypothetical protein
MARYRYYCPVPRPINGQQCTPTTQLELVEYPRSSCKHVTTTGPSALHSRLSMFRNISWAGLSKALYPRGVPPRVHIILHSCRPLASFKHLDAAKKKQDQITVSTCVSAIQISPALRSRFSGCQCSTERPNLNLILPCRCRFRVKLVLACKLCTTVVRRCFYSMTDHRTQSISTHLPISYSLLPPPSRYAHLRDTHGRGMRVRIFRRA